MSAERPQGGMSAGQRWIVPALALLFFGPVAAAAFIYFSGDSWRPAASVNYGRLLDPPIVLVDATPPAEFLKGHWSLVYISGAACDADCREALDKTRRVRLALREKAVRVQRIVLVKGNSDGFSLLAQEQPDLLAVSMAGSEGAALLGQFAHSPDAAPHARLVYLVDPLGNAMMVYEPGFEMKGMLADLKRLLKLSRIG